MGSYYSKNEEYTGEGVEDVIKNISPEDMVVLQVARKNLLNKEFKDYLENYSINSVYYNNILGTVCISSTGKSHVTKTRFNSNILFHLVESVVLDEREILILDAMMNF